MLNNLSLKQVTEIKEAVIFLSKWSLIAIILSIFIGSVSALFLWSLKWVTIYRESNSWIIYLLPISGFIIGLFYYYFGKNVEAGNNLVIDSINGKKEIIPIKMAPMIFVSTIITHLFGGSAGREGTALQFSASIADQINRFVQFSNLDRKIILLAGVAGGFASVFGTPLTGLVFALEFYFIGKIKYHAILPALLTALLSNEVAKLWNAPHTHYTIDFIPDFTLLNLIYAVLAGILFGLCAKFFSITLAWLGSVFKDRISFSPLRSLFGGVIIICLVFAIDSSQYLGLGIPTIVNAFNEQLSFEVSILKLMFTVITLSSGFKGGEVTPLFFIGATFGSALSLIIDLPTGLLAGMGFVAVFSGATNTPIACGIMGIELFGAECSLYVFIACIVAYLFSGNTSIYKNQRIGIKKFNLKFTDKQ